MEPVRGGVEAGLRLGVGKAEQESFYTAADNVVRKKLEVELQADENQERRDKREVQAPSLHTHTRAYASMACLPLPRPPVPASKQFMFAWYVCWLVRKHCHKLHT